MYDQDDGLPYDNKDERSILEYAGKLTGHTFVEVGVWDPEGDRKRKNKKGTFGQTLEEGYFLIPNNSSPEPDFRDVGIELKSTPMKRSSGNKLAPKERLVLGLINYMTINGLEFEGSFKKKNEKLLVVFYEWSEDKEFYEYRILKVVLWTYPKEDLWIIKEDWNIIAEMVKAGMAHQLSERLTRYLAACPKGVGQDQDMRAQPGSTIPAKQRALSLKQAYVNKIFTESIYEKHKGLFVNSNERMPYSDFQSLFDIAEWDSSETFEEYVLDYFAGFMGKTCREIENELRITLGRSKSYREALTRRMMGVEKKSIEEFLYADIKMKTIFLKNNGKPQESMSFSHFDYFEITNQEWEESKWSEDLEKRFFFVVFQRKKGDDDDTFVGAFFWSMPYDDLMEAKRVWEVTVDRIMHHQMDDLPRSVDSPVAHVRPHGRNSSDTLLAPDGNEYVKRCFWLNREYVARVVKNSGVLEKAKRLE